MTTVIKTSKIFNLKTQCQDITRTESLRSTTPHQQYCGDVTRRERVPVDDVIIESVPVGWLVGVTGVVLSCVTLNGERFLRGDLYLLF